MFEREPPPAPVRQTIGGPQSRCDLPLRFSMAHNWRPRAVDDHAPQRLDFTMVCEIDARKAGNQGSLRIWLDPSGGSDLRETMVRFLDAAAGDVESAEYAEMTVDEATGVQVHYLRRLPTRDTEKREAAFGLPTNEGMVIVTLSGLDTEEFNAMLPAYVLAKTTVTIPA